MIIFIVKSFLVEESTNLGTYADYFDARKYIEEEVAQKNKEINKHNNEVRAKGYSFFHNLITQRSKFCWASDIEGYLIQPFKLIRSKRKHKKVKV